MTTTTTKKTTPPSSLVRTTPSALSLPPTSRQKSVHGEVDARRLALVPQDPIRTQLTSVLASWHAAASPTTNSESVFGIAAYRRRLRTFGPATYFAKPHAVSPLTCARFGWENTARDLLVCAHKSCRAAICVQFHPLLGRERVRKLTRTYRTMLATSHCRGCPFRRDAERWLLPHTAVVSVPPYLTDVCPGLSVFDDAPSVVSRQADTLDVLLSHLTRHAHPDGAATLRFHVEVPQELRDYWAQEMAGGATTSSVLTLLPPQRQRFALPPDNDNHQHILKALPLPSPPSPVHDDIVASQESALLATFGWAPLQILDNGCELVVGCPICLAQAVVPLCPTAAFTDDSGHDNAATTTTTAARVGTKRPLHGGEQVAKRRKRERPVPQKSMRPIGSHRFFCPYVSAPSSSDQDDEPESTTTTRPGWQTIVSKLVRHQQQQQQSEQQKRPDKYGRESEAGERALALVRNCVRSGLSDDFF